MLRLFSEKKKLFTLLAILLILIALPLTVIVSREQQTIKQKAAPMALSEKDIFLFFSNSGNCDTQLTKITLTQNKPIGLSLCLSNAKYRGGISGFNISLTTKNDNLIFQTDSKKTTDDADKFDDELKPQMIDGNKGIYFTRFIKISKDMKDINPLLRILDFTVQTSKAEDGNIEMPTIEITSLMREEPLSVSAPSLEYESISSASTITPTQNTALGCKTASDCNDQAKTSCNNTIRCINGACSYSNPKSQNSTCALGTVSGHCDTTGTCVSGAPLSCSGNIVDGYKLDCASTCNINLGKKDHTNTEYNSCGFGSFCCGTILPTPTPTPPTYTKCATKFYENPECDGTPIGSGSTDCKLDNPASGTHLLYNSDSQCALFSSCAPCTPTPLTPTVAAGNVTLPLVLNIPDTATSSAILSVDLTLYSLTTNTAIAGATKTQPFTKTQIKGRQYIANITLPLSKDKYYLKARKDNMIAQSAFNISNSNGIAELKPLALVFGDLNNDNEINILDYEVFGDCLEKRSAAGVCASSDFDKSGTVDQIDYNIIIKGWATWNKEGQNL